MPGEPAARVGRGADVYARLREDILSGALEPGDRLAFAALVPRYECSVGVVREALQRLAEQGLVEAIPKHGFRVVEVSPEDLRDLTTARQEIEVLALRYAVVDGDTEWEAQLIASHHRLSQAAQFEPGSTKFSETWAKAHNAFHAMLLAGCSNRRILAAASSLRDSSELYWRWSAPTYDRDRDIAREHSDILDAALARDGERAGSLLSEHIGRTTEKLLAGIEGRVEVPGESPVQA